MNSRERVLTAFGHHQPDRVLMWCGALEEFWNTVAYQNQQQRTIKKRLTDIKTIKDRLLTAYLTGTIDEMTMQNKTTELTLEEKTLEMSKQMSNQAVQNDQAKHILSLFKCSQALGNLWNGSNLALKRQLLEIVSLNRDVSDVSLCLKKSKPFDVIEKIAVFKKSRRDRI